MDREGSADLAWQRLRQGQLDAAGQIILRYFDQGELAADLVQAFLSQAFTLLRHDWSREVLGRLERDFPDDSTAWRLQYHYWFLRRNWGRTLDCIDRVASLEGWSDILRIGRASVLEKKLEPERALAELERVSEQASEDPQTWLVRANILQQQSRPEQVVEELGARLPATEERTVVVARCWKVLGRALDRLGEYDRAWEALSTGNGLEKVLQQPDLDSNPMRMRVRINTAAFTPSLVRDWPVEPAASFTPTFLVGFPRSGTTLLEQVLDAHPGIQALEENNCLELAWSRLYPGMVERARRKGTITRNSSAHEAHVAATRELGELGTDAIETARQAYFDAVRASIDLDTDKVFVDKLPLNLVQIGFIRRLFPGARILVALRHPCDCVLSGYMQSFEMNEAMYNFLDIRDAATFYQEIMGLLQQYEQALGAADWHYVRYEDLLADFRGEVGSMLAWLGLEWHEAVERYHEHAGQRGTLGTPSYEGVTRPLYRSARGRWQYYRRHLEPVVDRLRPACEHLGYSLEEPGQAD